MNESFVWRNAVRYLETNGYSVICGCPPGATSYMYKNCCFVTAGKVDAPDLVFYKNGILYFCECKGTFSGLHTQNCNNESDFDKLRRIEVAAWSGGLDKQLDQNFGMLIGVIREFRSCVSYFGPLGSPIEGCHQIAVTKVGCVSDL